MGRSPCCSENDVKKGPWSPEEDQILVDYIHKHGHRSWKSLPTRAGLNRCGKSCRLRWTNYLRPDIKRGKFSDEEEGVIINLHSILGNKWSKIAANLPGRTDNEIKNFWNTYLRKKLLRMGIDPKTHKPIPDFNLLANLSHLLISTSNLGNSMNNALEFQSDATQLAKLQILHNTLQVINTKQLPNFEETNYLGPNNFTQFDGMTSKAINNNYTIDPFEELFGFLNKDGNPEIPSEYTAITSLPVSPEAVNNHVNNRTENQIPALVSATPENSTVNQMDSMNPALIPILSPSSNIFQAWETLVDDEDNSSFWNDIL